MLKRLNAKIFFAFVMSSLVLSAAGPTQAASIPDEQFVIGAPPSTDPSIGIVLEDSQFTRNSFSFLQAYTANGTKRMQSMVTSLVNCKSLQDAGCESSKMFIYLAALSRCVEPTQVDCIENTSVIDSNGKSLQVNFVEDFPGAQDPEFNFQYKGDPQANLPSGGSTFVVDIPEAPHAGGTQYLISAGMGGERWFNENSFTLSNFQVGIFAIKKINQSIYPPQPTNAKFATNLKLGQPSYFRIAEAQSSGEKLGCVQASSKACLLAYPLPTDLKFSLRLRLHTKISGWLHGRVSDAETEITTDSNGNQIVKLSGKPLQVPAIYSWIKKTDMPDFLKKIYEEDPIRLKVGTGFGGGPATVESAPSLLRDATDYAYRDLEEVLAWMRIVNDTAPLAPTVWSMRSMVRGEDTKNCYSDNSNVSGVVTTNSTFFVAGPPVFNQTDKTLDYKVASAHYLPNKEIFKGTYNLLIKDSVARCLYGFSNAPVSASVSIISSDGSSQVASTVLTQKNGWLNLVASGFTFSDPIIKVKLTQEGMNIPAKQEPVVKKVTITCVKGKISKKVTAISPKCPVGYKKK